jgi:hypothetical protein
VAAEEQEPLAFPLHLEELQVVVPVAQVILGHLPLTLMVGVAEEDLMRQQEPVGQEAAVQVVDQLQTLHQVPLILAAVVEEQDNSRPLMELLADMV